MADRAWDDIVQTMIQRRLSDSTLIRQMVDTRDRVNGDVVIALPDVKGEPNVPIPTPHLIADVIETTSMRCASTAPIIHVPALDPTSSRSKARANVRRRAMYAAWDYSSLLETILPRSYRHLCGYGTNSLIVVPDFDSGRARIETRDPLTAYPELRSAEDTREPTNVGFVYGRSAQWLLHHYPNSREYIGGRQHNYLSNNHGGFNPHDTLWDVVEWIDADQVVMGILGPRQFNAVAQDSTFSGGQFLKRWDNKAGMVPVACPRRVTLDRIDGQVSKLTGLVDMMGKLMALDVLAAEKAVFPDMVVIDQNGTPQLLNSSGKWNDGRTGEANLVKAAKVEFLQSAPGPLTHPVIDRLERNFRISGGMPGILGGENTNSLRTGNALDAMNGIAVDPRIQELQRLMTRALKVVNSSIIEVEKGYFPNKKAVYFSGWAGDRGHVSYTPSVDFESAENTVDYAFPGTDINQLTVAVAQTVGAGLMSKSDARRKHPLVDDAEATEAQILAEVLEDAAMQAIAGQAVAGALPLIDLANIYEAQFGEAPWTKAVKKAHDDAQKRQATPAEPASPAAQPGLAMPGQGVEALGQPSIPGANEATLDFSQLANALSSSPQ